MSRVEEMLQTRSIVLVAVPGAREFHTGHFSGKETVRRRKKEGNDTSSIIFSNHTFLAHVKNYTEHLTLAAAALPTIHQQKK